MVMSHQKKKKHGDEVYLHFADDAKSATSRTIAIRYNAMPPHLPIPTTTTRTSTALLVQLRRFDCMYVVAQLFRIAAFIYIVMPRRYTCDLVVHGR
jgi:hypothetical protein